MGRGDERPGRRERGLRGAPILIFLLVAGFLVQGAQEPPSYREGVKLLQEGRLEEAERAFLQALAESPAHAPSSVQLARVYSRSGRIEEARTTLEKALEKRPDGIGLLNELGSLLIEAGRPADARTIFERAVSVDPKNPRARAGLAESIGESGDLKGALAALDEARALDVRHRALDVYRATVEVQLGRPAEAVEILEKVLASSPDAPEAQRLLGLLAYSLNRDAVALDVLTKVLARDPADTEARATIGKVFFRRADYENARLTFERVLEDDEANGEARFYLGEIARSELRFEDAVQYYAKLSSIDARRGEAEAHFKLGRYDEAEKALGEALALDTEPRMRARILYLLGVLRSERGETEAALEALARAKENDPHHTETRYLLGTTLARLGRSEEARKELDLFRSLKLFEERKEKLELAILERPSEADSYRPLIELYLEFGRGAEALPYLEKALSLAPEDAGLLELQARIREGSERC